MGPNLPINIFWSTLSNAFGKSVYIKTSFQDMNYVGNSGFASYCCRTVAEGIPIQQYQG